MDEVEEEPLFADRVAGLDIGKAGMEATGDYWKPVFFLLESPGLDCELDNAGQVKALPGRPKTPPGRLNLAR